MRSPVVTAGLDATIAEAASRMATKAVHCLPLVDAIQHLLGIVTTTDVMRALLHGMGVKTAAAPIDGNPAPTDLTMRRAVEAANSATLQGSDPQGIAASLRYLHQRNALLEALRVKVTRDLRHGQDERLHSALVRDLGSLAERGQDEELSVAL